MSRENAAPNGMSSFIHYLAAHDQAEEQGLPALKNLSEELGIGIAVLREQLEVARALGFVEVRPRTGIRRRPFSFLPAVRQSLTYALALDETHFQAFADLRQHIEKAYWHEAVRRLTEEDFAELRSLVARAFGKLNGSPIQLPHSEHRQLHLLIYQRLNNPFVIGLLEAYWEAYEAIGLNYYTDLNYLMEVWNFHQKMVNAICSHDDEAGYTALLEHTDLIHQMLASTSLPEK